MTDHNRESGLSSEELRAIELIAQLAALSPEDDATSVRITARLGNGRLVGEALLSAKAVEALTDSVVSLNAYLADDPDAPLDGLQVVGEEAQIDADAVRMADQLEDWLREQTEGGQL